MKYGSVCSGIEAATVAWHPLNWQPMWFSEIEPFPNAVLQFHYPKVINLGDMTKLHENDTFQTNKIDLLVGGTPCQSFSIAGLRKGLDDPRGNLALEFLRLVDIKVPKWIVWENVPGVLSSGHGRDFGSFIGALQKLGYGFAYRILDAQYFGVPQRRRRVFVIGYFGDWRPAAAVLFESESLCGNFTKSRKKKQNIAAFTPTSIGGYDEGIGTLRASGGDLGGGSETLIKTFDFQSSGEYGTDTVASTVSARDYKSAKDLIIIEQNNVSSTPNLPSLRSQSTPNYAIAVSGDVTPKVGIEITPTHRADRMGAICTHSKIRRLTPKECERLQGFPDDYTLIPWKNKIASDGPRYKAIGNSMAVPVMHWIGRRIQKVDNIIEIGF